MKRDELIIYLLEHYNADDDFQWDSYISGKHGVTFP